MKPRIFIVDVFAEHAYSGNPLAVVVSTSMLSNEIMQKLAAEFNYSETTFLTPTVDNNGGYPIRIFTPSREIEFAGHPILGTAYVIREHFSGENCDHILLKLLQNQIPITFEHSPNKCDVAWFTAPDISLKETLPHDYICQTLGLKLADINTNLPVQVLSAGTSAIIVPLNNLKALQRCKFNLDNFGELKSNNLPPLIYLFCDQTYNSLNDINVRFFFEAHGVREDPATGNGAAFLGMYLLKHNFFDKSEFFIRIEQGHEVHRPSLIMLKAYKKNKIHKVQVGGNIIPILQGELY